MKQIPQTSIAFTLLSSALLLFITSACNSPKPDPEPQPDPIEEPVEDMTEDSVTHPCEVETAEDGCLSLEQYNEKKTRLIEQYENDPVYSNHWYGDKSGLSAAWSNIRLIHGASARPGAGVKIGMIDDGIDLTHPGLADASVTEHFLAVQPKNHPLPILMILFQLILTRHQCRRQYSRQRTGDRSLPELLRQR